MLSTRQLQNDLDAGRTLFNAIRSGAADSYAGAKSDWQRERKFDARFSDMHAISKWHRKRAFVTLVRSQFEAPLREDRSYTRAVNERIDAGTRMSTCTSSFYAFVAPLTGLYCMCAQHSRRCGTSTTTTQ